MNYFEHHIGDYDEATAQLIEDALRRRHKLKPPEPEA